MKVELVQPHAYLDVAIGGQPCGRVVFKLYADAAPKSCDNFLLLCIGRADSLTKEVRSYKNTYFHRIIRNFMVQGGDIQHGSVSEYGNDAAGKGHFSIYGDTFEDENTVEVGAPFLLCMANSGPNTNGSQFFVTTAPQPHLLGKHSVFGEVVHGKSVIREMENLSTDLNNLPAKASMVLISGCGEWKEGDAAPVFNASYNAIGGDIYEEHPDDDSHIDKESSESVYKAASIIKESGGLLFKSGEKQQAFFKYRKCLRYVMEFFPDPEEEPEWHAKYGDLKKKLYLNLSLVCLQLKNHKKAIDYSSYLLDMKEHLSPQELAKSHYRKGCAMTELKQYSEALKEFAIAKEILPNDAAILRDYGKCEGLLSQHKSNEKAKYARFFS